MSNTTVASLKPYPLYKESGIPWLGQLPEHWKVVPNKSVMQLRKKTVGEHFADYTLLSLTKQGVIPRNLDEPTGKFPESFDTYQVAEPGDLILCLFDVDETRRTIGIAKQRGMVTGAYTRFVCTDETTREFTYLLYLSLDDQKALKPLYTGLRKVITKESFLAAKIALPPPGEQAAIVRYLDDADQRIRAYVSAKERLIGLLEEQKQALIQQAVTRGLDPNVRLKPSGVEWLGKVPEHWQVGRLKAAGQIRYGLGQPPKESPTGLPLIRATNISQGHIVEKDLLRVDPEDVPTGRDAFLREKEIVVVRSGAYTADSAIIPKRYTGSVTGYDMVVTVTGAIPEFVAAALLSKYLRDDQLIIASSRAAQPHLNAEELGSAIVLLPPLSEQSSIVQHLDKANSDINKATHRARRQIDLMNEYRTRLIADVVTGKLDVRGAGEIPPMDL